ncbi:MAG: TonB-dependent receptor, partial [Sphingobacteriia bacterium]
MRNFLLFTLFLAPFFASAQFPGAGRPGGAGGQNMNIGRFYGKFVDAKTNKGIDGVTVQLKGNKFDTATKKMKEVILGTTITKANGDFNFEGLSIMGNFKLNASAIGYKANNQTINFGLKMPA